MRVRRLPFAPCRSLAALAQEADAAGRALARIKQASRGKPTAALDAATLACLEAEARLADEETRIAGVPPRAIARLPDRLDALEQLLAGELARVDAEEPAR
jgi:hypothetical protein